MSTKTASIVVRMDPELKRSAECIMDEIGISASSLITMLYKQVVRSGKIPFDACIERNLLTDETISDEEFDSMMKESFESFNGLNGVSVSDAFKSARHEYERM